MAYSPRPNSPNQRLPSSMAADSNRKGSPFIDEEDKNDRQTPSQINSNPTVMYCGGGTGGYQSPCSARCPPGCTPCSPICSPTGRPSPCYPQSCCPPSRPGWQGCCTPQCRPQQCSPPQCRPQQCTPQPCTPQQCIPQQCIPQQCIPQQCIPQQCIPQQCSPQQCYPQQCSPQQYCPQPACCSSPCCSPSYRPPVMPPSSFCPPCLSPCGSPCPSPCPSPLCPPLIRPICPVLRPLIPPLCKPLCFPPLLPPLSSCFPPLFPPLCPKFCPSPCSQLCCPCNIPRPSLSTPGYRPPNSPVKIVCDPPMDRDGNKQNCRGKDELGSGYDQNSYDHQCSRVCEKTDGLPLPLSENGGGQSCRPGQTDPWLQFLANLCQSTRPCDNCITILKEKINPSDSEKAHCPPDIISGSSEKLRDVKENACSCDLCDFCTLLRGSDGCACDSRVKDVITNILENVPKVLSDSYAQQYSKSIKCYLQSVLCSDNSLSTDDEKANRHSINPNVISSLCEILPRSGGVTHECADVGIVGGSEREAARVKFSCGGSAAGGGGSNRCGAKRGSEHYDNCTDIRERRNTRSFKPNGNCINREQSRSRDTVCGVDNSVIKDNDCSFKQSGNCSGREQTHSRDGAISYAIHDSEGECIEVLGGGRAKERGLEAGNHPGSKNDTGACDYCQDCSLDNAICGRISSKGTVRQDSGKDAYLCGVCVSDNTERERKTRGSEYGGAENRVSFGGGCECSRNDRSGLNYSAGGHPSELVKEVPPIVLNRLMSELKSLYLTGEADQNFSPCEGAPHCHQQSTELHGSSKLPKNKDAALLCCSKAVDPHVELRRQSIKSRSPCSPQHQKQGTELQQGPSKVPKNKPAALHLCSEAINSHVEPHRQSIQSRSSCSPKQGTELHGSLKLPKSKAAVFHWRSDAPYAECRRQSIESRNPSNPLPQTICSFHESKRHHEDPASARPKTSNTEDSCCLSSVTSIDISPREAKQKSNTDNQTCTEPLRGRASGPEVRCVIGEVICPQSSEPKNKCNVEKRQRHSETQTMCPSDMNRHSLYEEISCCDSEAQTLSYKEEIIHPRRLTVSHTETGALQLKDACTQSFHRHQIKKANCKTKDAVCQKSIHGLDDKTGNHLDFETTSISIEEKDSCLISDVSTSTHTIEEKTCHCQRLKNEITRTSRAVAPEQRTYKNNIVRKEQHPSHPTETFYDRQPEVESSQIPQHPPCNISSMALRTQKSQIPRWETESHSAPKSPCHDLPADALHSKTKQWRQKKFSKQPYLGTESSSIPRSSYYRYEAETPTIQGQRFVCKDVSQLPYCEADSTSARESLCCQNMPRTAPTKGQHLVSNDISSLPYRDSESPFSVPYSSCCQNVAKTSRTEGSHLEHEQISLPPCCDTKLPSVPGNSYRYSESRAPSDQNSLLRSEEPSRLPHYETQSSTIPGYSYHERGSTASSAQGSRYLHEGDSSIPCYRAAMSINGISECAPSVQNSHFKGGAHTGHLYCEEADQNTSLYHTEVSSNSAKTTIQRPVTCGAPSKADTHSVQDILVQSHYRDTQYVDGNTQQQSVAKSASLEGLYNNVAVNRPPPQVSIPNRGRKPNANLSQEKRSQPFDEGITLKEHPYDLSGTNVPPTQTEMDPTFASILPSNTRDCPCYNMECRVEIDPAHSKNLQEVISSAVQETISSSTLQNSEEIGPTIQQESLQKNSILNAKQESSPHKTIPFVPEGGTSDLQNFKIQKKTVGIAPAHALYPGAPALAIQANKTQVKENTLHGPFAAGVRLLQEDAYFHHNGTVIASQQIVPKVRYSAKQTSSLEVKPTSDPTANAFPAKLGLPETTVYLFQNNPSPSQSECRNPEAKTLCVEMKRYHSKENLMETKKYWTVDEPCHNRDTFQRRHSETKVLTVETRSKYRSRENILETRQYLTREDQPLLDDTSLFQASGINARGGEVNSRCNSRDAVPSTSFGYPGKTGYVSQEEMPSYKESPQPRYFEMKTSAADSRCQFRETEPSASFGFPGKKGYLIDKGSSPHEEQCRQQHSAMRSSATDYSSKCNFREIEPSTSYGLPCKGGYRVDETPPYEEQSRQQHSEMRTPCADYRPRCHFRETEPATSYGLPCRRGYLVDEGTSPHEQQYSEMRTSTADHRSRCHFREPSTSYDLPGRDGYLVDEGTSPHEEQSRQQHFEIKISATDSKCRCQFKQVEPSTSYSLLSKGGCLVDEGTSPHEEESQQQHFKEACQHRYLGMKTSNVGQKPRSRENVSISGEVLEKRSRALPSKQQRFSICELSKDHIPSDTSIIFIQRKSPLYTHDTIETKMYGVQEEPCCHRYGARIPSTQGAPIECWPADSGTCINETSELNLASSHHKVRLVPNKPSMHEKSLKYCASETNVPCVCGEFSQVWPKETHSILRENPEASITKQSHTWVPRTTCTPDLLHQDKLASHQSKSKAEYEIPVSKSICSSESTSYTDRDNCQTKAAEQTIDNTISTIQDAVRYFCSGGTVLKIPSSPPPGQEPRCNIWCLDPNLVETSLKNRSQRTDDKHSTTGKNKVREEFDIKSQTSNKKKCGNKEKSRSNKNSKSRKEESRPPSTFSSFHQLPCCPPCTISCCPPVDQLPRCCIPPDQIPCCYTPIDQLPRCPPLDQLPCCPPEVMKYFSFCPSKAAVHSIQPTAQPDLSNSHCLDAQSELKKNRHHDNKSSKPSQKEQGKKQSRHEK